MSVYVTEVRAKCQGGHDWLTGKSLGECGLGLLEGLVILLLSKDW
jgi:hypothetical protein